MNGAGPFAMPTMNMDGNDVDAVIEMVSSAAERARKGQGPTYICANTYRFRGHSMSDPLKYRSKEEAEAARARDPITIYEKRLREGQRVEGMLRIGAGAPTKVQLEIGRRIYFEEGELRVPPTFKPTEEEKTD